MENQKINQIMREVLETYYDIEGISVEDMYGNEEIKKIVTVWIISEEENVMNEILEQFEIPVRLDKETIKKFAYACIDVETLKDKLS